LKWFYQSSMTANLGRWNRHGVSVFIRVSGSFFTEDRKAR
jgi:hypothetical protein